MYFPKKHLRKRVNVQILPLKVHLFYDRSLFFSFGTYVFYSEMIRAPFKNTYVFAYLTLKRVVFERYGKTQHFLNKHIFSKTNRPHETLIKHCVFGYPRHRYTVKYMCFNLNMLRFVDKYTSLRHSFGPLCVITF